MDLYLIFLASISILLLIVLVLLGVPIAFAMMTSGLVGYILVEGLNTSMSQAVLVAWTQTAENFVSVCIPLFIVSGLFISESGCATDLYSAAYKWLGRCPGGLALATVFACAGFGAITGSSAATASTIGTIAKPQMDQYGYDRRLSTGVLASAGTLGVMIPPSLVFVFYGMMTDESIGQLFIAGIFPGIITAIVWAAVVYMLCSWNPTLAPPAPAFSWKERFRSLSGIWPIVVLFLVITGSIYGGIFTPTEAAALGALSSFLIAFLTKRMNRKIFLKSLMETSRLTAMIMAIMIGAILYSQFLALTGLTDLAIKYLLALEVNKYILLVGILVIYLCLGMILDVYGMLALTLPVVYPVLIKMGFSGIWGGVIMVVMSEIALITPPVGINVFVISGVAPDVPMEDIFKGILPFLAAEMLIIALLIFFPEIATWLPGTMVK